MAETVSVNQALTMSDELAEVFKNKGQRHMVTR